MLVVEPSARAIVSFDVIPGGSEPFGWRFGDAAALFDVVLRGEVKVKVNQKYALKDAARAHRDLEARKTTGSTVLVP